MDVNKDFDFHKTTTPTSRKADYNLCCLDSSVFMDFNSSPDNKISLIRISFDGFGCCNIDIKAKNLDLEDSQRFIQEINKEKLNQVAITELVKKAIRINKEFIWTDALEKYEFIEND